MKFLVVNGSPKGKYSITLQTCLYLEKRFGEHEFKVLNAGQTIRALEKDFTPAKDALEWADTVIFSYPVYTFIAPYQLHRFIEILKASDIDINGKFATQISTSKHFYDVTAHRYIKENALDMGFKYLEGLSQDMDDLLKKEGRETVEKFFNHLLWSINEGIYEYNGKKEEEPYVPCPASGAENAEKREGDVVIVTDVTDKESNLYHMIERFMAKLPIKSRIINISEYPFSGGCLGCFNCAVSGMCVYKDGFDNFLRENIQKADAIIYAFTVSDHSMGSRFKLYDDRQFCNGHRTVTVGTPVGYLVSGRYGCEENLKNIIEARAQVGRNFLSGVATDEANTDTNIDNLVKRLDYALINKVQMPQNFFGIGGMKIFRDLIYLMRGMMRADHKFYKKGGYYDFPQKHRLTSWKMYLVGFLLSSEEIGKKMGNKMNDGMLMPYKKMFEKLDKEK